MHRLTKAAVAAATTLAVAGGAVAVADEGEPEKRYSRESASFWIQRCEWEVDKDGKPVLDKDGNPIPVIDPETKKQCTVEQVEKPNLAAMQAPQGSSGIEVTPGWADGLSSGGSKESSSSKGSDNEPNWADKDNSSSELSAGAIVGIIGAVIAAIVGIFWIFVEDFNIRLIPAAPPAPRR